MYFLSKNIVCGNYSSHFYYRRKNQICFEVDTLSVLCKHFESTAGQEVEN